MSRGGAAILAAAAVAGGYAVWRSIQDQNNQDNQAGGYIYAPVHQMGGAKEKWAMLQENDEKSGNPKNALLSFGVDTLFSAFGSGGIFNKKDPKDGGWGGRSSDGGGLLSNIFGQRDKAPTAAANSNESPGGGSFLGNLLGGGFQNVVDAGAGFTVVTKEDGSKVRRDGTRAWRNNNPGNIEYGNFAKKHGAVGTDGRFAVFPTYEMGRAAKGALLFDTSSYSGKTILGAINRYAPPFENDTNRYAGNIASALGISVNTPTASLTAAQREIMLDSMERTEGFKVGSERSWGG